MARSRRGFTLVELLIAAVMGMAIVGLGIQHLYEYFKLQAVLMTKAELRHDVQLVQEKVAAKLRYALKVVPLPANAYIVIVPIDSDNCGYICHLDIYQVLWWTVGEDAVHPELKVLNEKKVEVPAFQLPEDGTALTQLFDPQLLGEGVPMGRGKRIATGVDALSITRESDGLYRTAVSSSRPAPYRKEILELTLNEQVALRTAAVVKGIPKFDALIETLKKKAKAP